MKARRDNRAGPAGFVRRGRSALMVSTALQAGATLVLSLPVHAQPAPNARPAGGTVVAGAAAISRTTNNTQIEQSTQRAAINWKSFDVGSQQRVTFNQPSANAVTLNRVTGPDPSQIAGRIDANGQIVLVNQSGVNFYKGAQVNAAGVMVSSANITNQNFMNGVMTFDKAGKPDARIDNQGSITIKQAGLAALVAPQVSNSGVITARLGHVVLAGAQTATLDLYGDGLLSLNVSNQVTQAPVGKDGKPVTALVTNTGVIVADGGTVQLTARAADGIVQNLVQAGGKIRAATVGDRPGVVALNGVGGSIVVEGQITAPGAATGTTGGAIEIASNAGVAVAPAARIDASGKAGGGTVAIGTTLQRAKGGPGVTPTLVAANTVIQKGAQISANATDKGNGGTITVLSNQSTNMSGDIAAKGGSQGGNGGMVELSGRTLALNGSVDVSAPLANQGTILLDPFDLQVVAGGGGTEATNFGNNGGTVIANDGLTGSPDTIGNAVINAFGGNVELQAINNLTISAPITLSGPGASLTLRAGNNLAVDPGVAITLNNGAATMTAADPTIAGFTATGSIAFNGSLSGATTATLSAGLGGIALNGGIKATTLDLATQGGGVTQTGGAVTAATLQSTNNVIGSVSLPGSANAIASIGDFSVAGGGSFSLTNSAPLTVGGKLSSAGDLFLEVTKTGGSITVASTGTVTAGAANVAAFRASQLSVGAGGFVTGGTFQYAPLSGPLQLGAGGNLSSLAGVAANQAELGGVTAPGTGFSVTASSINTVGTFNANGLPLDLRTAGTISEGAGAPIVNVAILTGQAAAVTLDQANDILNIGNFSATSGDFLLKDSGTLATLTVSGTVSATNVTLGGAAALAVTGSIGATGFVDIGSFGTVNETGNAIISAGTLQSTAGVGGDFQLLGTANAIDKLGTISIGGTGNFALVDANALQVTGAVSVAGASKQLSLTTPSLAISGTGALSANTTGGLVSLQTDTFANSGKIKTATLELAPISTPRTITLGASAPNTLSLLSLAGVTATDLVIGAVTPVGGTRGTTAAAISIGGTFDTTGILTATLDAVGSVTQNAPFIGGSQINGAASGYTLLQTNAFSSLSLTANTGDILIADSAPVSLGPMTAPGNIYIGSPGETLAGTIAAGGVLSFQTDAFSVSSGHLQGSTVELAPLTVATQTLGVPGSLNAGIVSGNLRIGAVTIPGKGLTPTAGTIAVSGNFGIPTLPLELDTIGAGSTISQGPGAILTAGTLTGTASNVALGTTVNAITTLGSFTAANFTLNDGLALTVAGPLTIGNSATITDTAALLVSGTIAPLSGNITVGLTAAALDIPGLVNTGTAGTLSIVANAGTIGETGAIIAGTLTGSAGGFADLTGTAFSNQIGTLNGFTAAGFILDDAVGLTVAGTVSGGRSVTINDTGALAINGSITAAAVNLTADGIAIPGNISGGNAALTARKGTISETGAIVAGTLTGDAPGSALLTGTSFSNQIGTLGGFTANGFQLDDAIGLSVAGTVSGGPSATIRDNGALAINGAVTATAVSLTANGMAIPGGVTGGSVALVSTGAITETGVLNAGTLTGSSATTAGLTGNAFSNSVGTLSDFSAAGFALDDGASLTVAGTVSGGPSIMIRDNAALSVTGFVTAGAISLAGASVDITGNVTGSAVALVSTSGAITEVGDLHAGTLSGSAATSAVLIERVPFSSNQIGTLNDFTAAGLTLHDSVNLVVAGAVSGGSSVTIQDKGALTVNGAITAAAVNLAADSIAIPGNVSGGIVALFGTIGAIAETGVLNAGTLGGSAATSASLTGSNQIGTVGDFTASGFTLSDGADLTLAGNLNGGPNVTLAGAGSMTVAAGASVSGSAINASAGGSIAIAGAMQATTLNLLSSTGGISGSGILSANALTANAAGDVALTGANNQIRQLTNSAAADFALTDAAPLLVTGTLTATSPTGVISLTGNAPGASITLAGTMRAPTIVVDSGANPIVLANNAAIIPGGSTRPGVVPVDFAFPGETPATQVNGAYLTTSSGFTQTGTSSVSSITGGATSVLRINATRDANIAFDPLAGVQGKATTWLILSLGTGRASGQVNVRNLDLIRGGAGSTNLTGTVLGITGPAAAGVSGIAPSPNANFRFNGCPIHSVNCVLLTTQAVPVTNPLNDIYFGSLFNPDDENDLLLPIVSDRDY